MLRPAILAAAIALMPGAVWAQGAPRSIEDCERIQAPMAYNDCLSRFGPERGGGGAVRGRRGGREGISAPRRGGPSVGRRSNGRKFLIIEPPPRRR